MSQSHVQAVFLMADYGHDPTGECATTYIPSTQDQQTPETAVPYTEFKAAGYDITIATQHGAVAACDSRMLTGWTQILLGADQNTISQYTKMISSPEWQHPRAYTDPNFTLDSFDLVFLPGGHDKGIRQLLDDPRAQELLVAYFPLTSRLLPHDEGSRPKICAAVCHGVQMLAHSRNAAGVSVLWDVETTALPSFFESSVYGATWLVLGDYYKTYGKGTDNVETIVKASLSDQRQFKCSINVARAFVVEDKRYRYVSGRWPGDAKLLGQKVVQMIDALSS